MHLSISLIFKGQFLTDQKYFKCNLPFKKRKKITKELLRVIFVLENVRRKHIKYACLLDDLKWRGEIIKLRYMKTMICD